jgi:hypothetical protein
VAARLWSLRRLVSAAALAESVGQPSGMWRRQAAT